jgi:hypothetical protein
VAVEERHFQSRCAYPNPQLYQNFKWWFDVKGLYAVSRPKLRDVLCVAQAGIRSIRKRAIDMTDGSSKMLWRDRQFVTQNPDG